MVRPYRPLRLYQLRHRLRCQDPHHRPGDHRNVQRPLLLLYIRHSRGRRHIFRAHHIHLEQGNPGTLGLALSQFQQSRQRMRSRLLRRLLRRIWELWKYLPLQLLVQRLDLQLERDQRLQLWNLLFLQFQPLHLQLHHRWEFELWHLQRQPELSPCCERLHDHRQWELCHPDVRQRGRGDHRHHVDHGQQPQCNRGPGVKYRRPRR